MSLGLLAVDVRILLHLRRSDKVLPLCHASPPPPPLLDRSFPPCPSPHLSHQHDSTVPRSARQCALSQEQAYPTAEIWGEHLLPGLQVVKAQVLDQGSLGVHVMTLFVGAVM